LLNSAELWPVSVTQMKKLEAAHHRWQRSILGISWKDKVTSEKVREATALPKLKDVIRCRHLRWPGHLSRTDHHTLPQQALIWTRGFQEEAWSTATELERCRQERSRKNGHQLGLGCRGCGGQEELEESCRPIRLRRGMNQEPYNIPSHYTALPTTGG